MAVKTTSNQQKENKRKNKILLDFDFEIWYYKWVAKCWRTYNWTL